MLKKYREEKVLVGKIYYVACTRQQTWKIFSANSHGHFTLSNATLQLLVQGLEVVSSTQDTVTTITKQKEKNLFSTASPPLDGYLKKLLLPQTINNASYGSKVPPPFPSQFVSLTHFKFPGVLFMFPFYKIFEEQISESKILLHSPSLTECLQRNFSTCS